MQSLNAIDFRKITARRVGRSACILAAAFVAVAAGSARASTIAQVEAAGATTGSSSATIGDSVEAVVTAIASAPGTLDGYTKTTYTLIVNDGTGSLEVFGYNPTTQGGGYDPVVGDAVEVTTAYSVYQGIPELATGNNTTTGTNTLSLVNTDSGDPVPAPTLTSIPQIKAGANQATISEYVLQVDNVTLSGASTFVTHGNTTLTATDSSSNTMTVYQWASSYSAAAAFGGQAVPTGLVDITGIVDYFGTPAAPEFIPFSIVSVPEPVGMSLLAMSGVALLGRRRRNAVGR